MSARNVLLAFPLFLAACKNTPLTPPRVVATNFDGEAVGALPAHWKAGSTHASGADASWSVRADASAPSAPNVLAMTKANSSSEGTFNVCWTDAMTLQEGAIEVRLRADGGEADQGGGVVWRVQGMNDYYVCRYNPLESNFRVYVVIAGDRRQLATATVPGDGKGWHLLRVEHALGHVVCTLDGATKLEAQDDTLPHVGGLGLWTKADACTSFDDLKVTPVETR
ncbi:MAG: hypothetical protein HZA53_19055 [Planctomycetes bacterium]|nr:hypothetical protein [Planctomycetota bacterium]